MEQNEVITSTKKLVNILIIVVLILLGITGGLVYADYKEYKYTPKQESFPENLSITLGMYGTYKVVYDTQKKVWTFGVWEETLIFPGVKTISELQKDGGVIVFEMPQDGVINCNAGEIYIDGKKWNLGNPIINSKGITEIKKGQQVEIRYGKENQSAGFQIWFM